MNSRLVIAVAQMMLAFASLTPGVSQAQSAKEGGSVEEIVVTAQRIESPLSHTPLAVSALTGADLQKAGATNPKHSSSA